MKYPGISYGQSGSGLAKRVTLFNLEGARREIEGDIAQLGERLPCKQEVAGSNPTISTKRIKRHLVQDEGP